MDAVVEALACAPVEWGYQTACCGAGLALCQVNLDTRQDDIAKADPSWQRLPVLYVSQVVGRALGIDGARLGLKKHMVDVAAVMS